MRLTSSPTDESTSHTGLGSRGHSRIGLKRDQASCPIQVERAGKPRETQGTSLPNRPRLSRTGNPPDRPSFRTRTADTPLLVVFLDSFGCSSVSSDMKHDWQALYCVSPRRRSERNRIHRCLSAPRGGGDLQTTPPPGSTGLSPSSIPFPSLLEGASSQRDFGMLPVQDWGQGKYQNRPGPVSDRDGKKRRFHSKRAVLIKIVAYQRFS